jgi:hypothetical protein
MGISDIAIPLFFFLVWVGFTIVFVKAIRKWADHLEKQNERDD